LINLFFERHLMHDARRAELLAMDDETLVRAVRHRFRQVVVDADDEYRPYHALRAQVRDVLDCLAPAAPAEGAWPASISERGSYSRALVEQAVVALWRDNGRRPQAQDATAELYARYVKSGRQITQSRQAPETISRRLDGQRLAAAILDLLTADEKDLLRHVLADAGSVEDWAHGKGCSRATAYRLMARL